MVGSTASQVAANIVSGKKPFQNVDYGLNPGLLLPLVMDGLKYSQKFAMYMARKQCPNEEIVGVSARATPLMPNGNLHYEQSLYIQEYYPADFKFEIIEDMGGNPNFLAGQPRPILSYPFNSMFIQNYRGLALSIFNLQLYK
jgi:hypothetical protein